MFTGIDGTFVVCAMISSMLILMVAFGTKLLC